MKKVLLFAFILIGLEASAQKTDVGIKLGPSLTVTQGNLKNDYGNGQVRFHAGIFTREKLGKISVICEAVYVNTSASKDGVKYNLNSLNVPLLLEAGSGKLAFHFGVSPSLVLSSTQTKLSENQRGEVKDFNVDLAAGLRYQISEKIGINARYTVPVLNYSTNETRHYGPMGLHLSLNYTLKTFM